MAPSLDPKIAGTSDWYRIEDFPLNGEPDGQRYMFVTRSGSGRCFGYCDDGEFYCEGGDPVTPIYWARDVILP